MALLPEIVRRVVRAKLSGGISMPARGQKQLPSISIYFSDPLADLISTGAQDSERPIQRLSRTVFACGGTAVVVRYAHKRDLAVLNARRFSRVYLLIDDDLENLEQSDGLPQDYRRKLIVYRDGPFRRLMDLVTDVVAPSENILSAYSPKRAIHLDPAQCHQTAALVHHHNVRPFDIVFAATRSHLHDLSHVAPALAEVLRRRPDARLTTFLNGHAPRSLRNLPNAIHLPMMEWSRYRAYVAENRFHVAIAPALDTPFNRARSISKLHDHAAFGAAGVYSHQQPFDRIVAHNQSGLLISNQPEEWRDSLLDLAERREKTLKLASGGQILSQTLGDIRRVRNFWIRELGLA
ncbi:hypothetical protein [Aestuariivirga sp.]|uniref:hypothetical protein n=1 Tax=Aestuariivirga sp. TaxID=2650926 RepID=UPI003593DED5